MKFRGTLLKVDGVPDFGGDIFTRDCKIEISKDILVTYEFDKSPKGIVGSGRVYKRGTSLRYDIEIFPGKIPKEIIKHLTPAVGGYVIEKKGKKITKCKINQIGLSMSGNFDPRIKKISEQK
jgi:hypothetical protein